MAAGSIDEKLDTLLRNQTTLNNEVHTVVQRIADIERWRDDQEGVRRATQRSLTENDVRDQVIVNMVGQVEERMLAMQASVDAMTAAQAVAADTNRSQTLAVQHVATNLQVTSSMAPVVAKLRARMPAYLIIAAFLGAIVAAFVQAYLKALAKG